jgi:hypothetical protein
VAMKGHRTRKVPHRSHDGHASRDQFPVRLKKIVLAIHIEANMKADWVLHGLAFGKRAQCKRKTVLV